jgi:hypothetical protein
MNRLGVHFCVARPTLPVSSPPYADYHAGTARRPVPLKTVTMRLPVPDIKAAQDLAHEKGLPYQTYMKMLLHEALKKERSA